MPPPRAGLDSLPPFVETLEGRRLLSVTSLDAVAGPDILGPRVEGIRLVGPNSAITGIVVTFNEPLNPVTAQDTDAFIILKKVHKDGSDGGLLDAFVPYVDTSTSGANGVRKLKFDAAVYDDTARTVTLTPRRTFHADTLLRQFRVDGKGNHAVTDAAGNPLDGKENSKNGDNAILKFHIQRGRSAKVTDSDGDKFRLKLTGPGKIITLTRRSGPAEPMIFLEKTDAGRSILTGTITRGRAGDGVVDIAELTGTAAAQIPFLTDPAFRIEMTQV